MVVVDATDAVVGRLAVAVVKELKKGEKVQVVNLEKAIITGTPDQIIEFYKTRVDKGERYHGPFFPKRPDGIFKRALRGMVAYKRKSGREMMANLRVYSSTPKTINMDDAKKLGVKVIRSKYITLGELSKRLGGI